MTGHVYFTVHTLILSLQALYHLSDFTLFSVKMPTGSGMDLHANNEKYHRWMKNGEFYLCSH